MITSKEWRFWLRTLGHPQNERAPRRTPVGLAAMHVSGAAPKLGRIKIISRNGIFLQTTERWPIGAIVPLTLQRVSAGERDSEFQLDVRARVASYGEDGVGLGFVLPKGLNSGLWEHVIDSADTPDETEDVQFIFRMVRAILFIYRLCPAKAEEPVHQITGELDEFRTANMLTIAMVAEKMLSERPDSVEKHAHPHIVADILRNGSWEKDDATQRMWAGLLVSSCDEHGTDESNRDLVDLLVEVTTSQVHILIDGCRRSAERWLSTDGSASLPIILDQQEMIRVTGMYDVYRNATDVAYLHNLGLIERNFDFSTHSSSTDFDVTPTVLGMRLYRTCLGNLIEDAVSSS